MDALLGLGDLLQQITSPVKSPRNPSSAPKTERPPNPSAPPGGDSSGGRVAGAGRQRSPQIELHRGSCTSDVDRDARNCTNGAGSRYVHRGRTNDDETKDKLVLELVNMGFQQEIAEEAIVRSSGADLSLAVDEALRLSESSRNNSRTGNNPNSQQPQLRSTMPSTDHPESKELQSPAKPSDHRSIVSSIVWQHESLDVSPVQWTSTSSPAHNLPHTLSTPQTLGADASCSLDLHLAASDEPDAKREWPEDMDEHPHMPPPQLHQPKSTGVRDSSKVIREAQQLLLEISVRQKRSKDDVATETPSMPNEALGPSKAEVEIRLAGLRRRREQLFQSCAVSPPKLLAHKANASSPTSHESAETRQSPACKTPSLLRARPASTTSVHESSFEQPVSRGDASCTRDDGEHRVHNADLDTRSRHDWARPHWNTITQAASGLGMRVKEDGNGNVFIHHVQTGGAAAAADPFLKVGDRVISIGGNPVKSEHDVKQFAAGPIGSPILFHCSRSAKGPGRMLSDRRTDQNVVCIVTLISGVPGAHTVHTHRVRVSDKLAASQPSLATWMASMMSDVQEQPGKVLAADAGAAAASAPVLGCLDDEESRVMSEDDDGSRGVESSQEEEVRRAQAEDNRALEPEDTVIDVQGRMRVQGISAKAAQGRHEDRAAFISHILGALSVHDTGGARYSSQGVHDTALRAHDSALRMHSAEGFEGGDGQGESRSEHEIGDGVMEAAMRLQDDGDSLLHLRGCMRCIDHTHSPAVDLDRIDTWSIPSYSSPPPSLQSLPREDPTTVVGSEGFLGQPLTVVGSEGFLGQPFVGTLGKPPASLDRASAEDMSRTEYHESSCASCSGHALPAERECEQRTDRGEGLAGERSMVWWLEQAEAEVPLAGVRPSAEPFVALDPCSPPTQSESTRDRGREGGGEGGTPSLLLLETNVSEGRQDWHVTCGRRASPAAHDHAQAHPAALQPTHAPERAEEDEQGQHACTSPSWGGSMQTRQSWQSPSPCESARRYKQRCNTKVLSPFVFATIDYADLALMQPPIGTGSTKTVFKAMWKHAVVAAQLIREHDSAAIHREVSLLQSLGKHPYLPLLHGVAKDHDGMLYVISEFFSLGGLDLQLEIWEDRLSPNVRLCIGLQICEAMKAVHERSILHRDLATRNVLVHSISATNVARVWVKVSDFGLACAGREAFTEDHVTKETTVPWRWTAPEVHELSYWCQATDVWAFGVTFWEVFTNALIPFYDISDDTELRHRIFTKGERLPRPASCGTSLYAIMQHCWAHEHRERPTFADLVKRLQNASSALVRDGDLFEL